MALSQDFQDRLLSLGLARVSEAAALASAKLIGRGDEKAADQAAVNAMRDQLNLLDIAGVVVIGEGERDEESHEEGACVHEGSLFLAKLSKKLTLG